MKTTNQARKPDARVTVTQGRATYRVQPANAQRLRDNLFKLERAKPSRPKVPKADYFAPVDFKPGMTTAEYVRSFQLANCRGTEAEYPRLKFTFADRAAPMLDPACPEVHEEADPEYVEPEQVRKPRAKRQTYSLADIRNGTGWPDGARFQLVAA